MFYGPGNMYYATSKDLNDWKSRGIAFHDSLGTRDPNVQFFDGIYHMYYCKSNGISHRTSSDLVHWSESTEIIRLNREGSMESPFVVFNQGYYYLFWTIYDGTNTAYDWRTTVVRSKTKTGFSNGETLGILLTHAPEIVRAENGNMFISSVEWPVRGISLAKFAWTKDARFPVMYHAIPGIIQAANFDNGGEGIAYHKVSVKNGPKLYRSLDKVDIERAAGNDYEVTSLVTGEWLAYTVSVQKTKLYDVAIKLTGNGTGACTFHLTFDGRKIPGPVNVSFKGTNTQLVALHGINLNAGLHTMRIVIDSNNSSFAIQSFTFR